MNQLVATEPSKRILITGAGIVSPLGLDWQANERSFRNNRMNVTPVTMFDVSQRFAKTACQVDLPEERLFSKLPSHRDGLIDRGTKMLILAIREALAMAKMPGMKGLDAIIIGTSAGAMSIGQDYFRHARSSPFKQAGQLARIEYYQPHQQLNAIAIEYDWHGPMIVISNACASGANAIGDAMAMIQAGKARRVLAGGYDAIAELVFSGFDTLRALAPSGIPRPFDAARDGLALGEGAAVVLLESEDAAAERGAEAVCQAAGYAMATDLHHLTQPDPEGKAANRTMSGACQMAGISAHEIHYINSHGTGTPYNDVAEASAIHQWAGEAAGQIAVSSTKSAMGHLLGGAGAVEAVICAMALRGQWMPASLNVREIDPAVCFDLVREFRESPVRVALTNSFGFGGTNATLVLKHNDTASNKTSAIYRPGTLRIHGVGAVSPAGWGAEALVTAVTAGQALPATATSCSYIRRDWPCEVRQVPPVPLDRLPKFPRLRRASPITKFSLAAALEALEQAGFPKAEGAGRLGIVQCMFNGCVQFSGKFYHEVIETPALASPLIFPETVYNAPASHVAAFLGVDGPATTLIGESSAIIEALSIAHTWLQQDLVDHVLVIGAEECDWVSAEAVSYYHPELQAAEGAGALVLSLQGEGVKLAHTTAQAFHNESERAQKISELTRNPPRIGAETGIAALDTAETMMQTACEPEQTTSLQPRRVLGEGMGAAGAWQLVLATGIASKEGHPVRILLPGTLCAAYSAFVG